jgi:hypothetical protein
MRLIWNATHVKKEENAYKDLQKYVRKKEPLEDVRIR